MNTWLLTCNDAFETSTEDTFLFGRGLNRPDFCRFIIFGDFIKKVDSVDIPATGISPSQTPETSGHSTNVKVDPSALMSVTLWNIGSVNNPVALPPWYPITDSVLIPTLPENLLNGQLAVAEPEPPVIPKTSVVEKLGNVLL